MLRLCYNVTMIVIYPLIIVAIIVADQITKYLIRANLSLGDRISIVGDWFNITYVQNTGTAFSMFEGNQFVTLVLTSVLLIICVIAIVSEHRSGNRFLTICFTCVLAGGLGNMIDRFALGYVTDMISCGSFAVFNVADIFVTCGCILAMIGVVAEFVRENKKK